MQKIVNVLAVASFAVSGAVVGRGLYVYVNRASIIDGIKSQALEAVAGSLGSLVDDSMPEMPSTTGGVAPIPSPAAPTTPSL